MTQHTTIRELAERYDTLLFDSYGVLVNEEAGLPGAAELIDWLERSGKSYQIVTNDASRSLRSRAQKFIEQGVPVPQERIVNSGSLIPLYIRENGFSGEPTVVLGSSDAIAYAEEGEAKVVPLDRMSKATLFIIADDSGFDWRTNMNRLISVLNQKTLDGEPFKLMVPNPDLFYPSGDREFSFAAAALAEMLEAALNRLFGKDHSHHFVRLGKPHAPIFDEALRRVGVSRDNASVVMIGDQLETDIAGAVAYGIPSAIVTTGINRFSTEAELSALPANIRPNYVISNLSTN